MESRYDIVMKFGGLGDLIERVNQKMVDDERWIPVGAPFQTKDGAWQQALYRTE